MYEKHNAKLKVVVSQFNRHLIHMKSASMKNKILRSVAIYHTIYMSMSKLKTK